MTIPLKLFGFGIPLHVRKLSRRQRTFVLCALQLPISTVFTIKAEEILNHKNTPAHIPLAFRATVSSHNTTSGKLHSKPRENGSEKRHTVSEYHRKVGLTLRTPRKHPQSHLSENRGPSMNDLGLLNLAPVSTPPSLSPQLPPALSASHLTLGSRRFLPALISQSLCAKA